MSDYAKYTVPQLWESLRAEDDAEVWRVVGAWRDTATVVDVQRGVLMSAREELLAAWPAEGSSAAAVFKTFVDELIAAMDDTANAAAKNYTALSRIVTGVMTAKAEVQHAYVNWIVLNQASGPEPATGALSPASQQVLQQAITAMEQADARIAEAAATLTVPVKFELMGLRDPATDTAGTQHDTSGKVNAGTAGPATGSAYSAGYLQQPEITPPVVGIATPATLTGGSTTLTGGTAPLPGTTTTPGNLPTGAGAAPGFGQVSAPGPLGAVGGAVGARRVLPPGGVIGQQSGQGVRGGPGGRSGAGTAARAGAARKWMPPGGVIGGNPEARGARSGAVGGRGAAPGAGLGGRKLRREGEARRFDPDNPWAVEQGVPPVLEAPPEEGPHDAGPGVIGLDRW